MNANYATFKRQIDAAKAMDELSPVQSAIEAARLTKAERIMLLQFLASRREQLARLLGA